MNINKKYIIIFGTLVLLLIIITGAITYHNEKRKEQVQTGFSQYGYYLRPPKEGQVQIPNES